MKYLGEEASVGGIIGKYNQKDISYVNLEKKAEQQKILEIVNSDDENKFIEDTNNINDGYPVLNWQKNSK